MLVQGGNPAAPAAMARAPGANAAVRSRPAAEKAGKAAGTKRRKVPTSRNKSSSTSHSIPPQGGAPAMPFNSAAPPASEVFDEMAGRYISSDFGHSLSFSPLFSIARDLLSFPIAVVRTMQQPSS